MVTAPALLRREIARAVAREACGDRPPMIALLIAQAFAARLVDVSGTDRTLRLAGWAERTCERYGGFPSTVAVLSVCCEIAKAVVRERDADDEALATDLDILHGFLASRLAVLHAASASQEPPLSDGVDEAIAAFLVRLDETDPLSAEHSRAVSLWCRRLARRLVLPDDRCTFVMRGGMLHDVGKTTTPREILLAPRALTADEFATMRDHATAGATMIDEIERLRPFVPVVRSHHERLDGKGYPDRLSERDISLDVRIVAVADCFNAMIGRRPYRRPMTPANALDQLVQHRGTQFDPFVVEAMVDVVEHPDDEVMHA
jgi:putative nucleotidyltransferase with HDIG domain